MKRIVVRPTEVVTFRIFPGTLREFDRLAAEMGLHRSDAFRTAVRAWIKTTDSFLKRTRGPKGKIVHHLRLSPSGPYSPCGDLFKGAWREDRGLLSTDADDVTCSGCRAGKDRSWSDVRAMQQSALRLPASHAAPGLWLGRHDLGR